MKPSRARFSAARVVKERRCKATRQSSWRIVPAVAAGARLVCVLVLAAARLKSVADDLDNLVTVEGALREYVRDIEMRHDIPVENVSEPRKDDHWDVRPVGNLRRCIQ